MKLQLTNKFSSTLTFISLIGFSLIALALFQDAAVSAQVRDGIDATGTGPGVTVEEVVRNAINLFSWIVGIIAVVMLIIGGLKYITSTGDASKVDAAKNTILYAVIGLAIAALAQVIVRFVLGEVGV
jgi:hypothetical protein